MAGEMIPFSHLGEPFAGYLALPEQATGLGVIVLQEWWGLNDHIKDVTDRLAKMGFVALAPDLYRKVVTTDPDEAETLFQALNIAETERILAEAVRVLQARPEITKPRVGVIGFCMGGQLAMYAASKNPEIGACVNFYGIHVAVEPEYENLKAPILGLFGENDASVPFSTIEELDKRLTELGKTHVFHVFEGVGHAFFNDTRPEVYDAVQAAEAWDNTLKFLVKHLFYRAQ